MNIRSFFKQYGFWGKALGAFFGFMMAGPAGALFGLLIGNFFDRGLSQHYNRPYWEVYIQRKSATQTLFIQTTFMFLGYLAKSDGQVSQRAIQYANRLMSDLHLASLQRRQARDAFQVGKKHEFDFIQTLLNFKHTVQMHPDLMMTFLNILYQAARHDGLTLKKVRTLNHIFQTMGFAPVEQQFRFYQDAPFEQTQHQQTHGRYHTNQPTTSALASAYTILGIHPNANQATTKQAYRRLIGRNHPDKLIAQGKSEAEIKQANEKTQQIRKAYEVICAAKGWNS
ncbi:MAG: co-chaperone DjlA [Gammaproteobacteria bacterium]|nr:co-chaperone DjlA [Gammaproteobacteria bacterium]